MAGWNPWHGCRRISEGCRNCYVYRIDARHGRDASVVFKTGEFDLPLRKKRDGSFHIPPGETVFTCFSSDFFLDLADSWRPEAWAMIRSRPDLRFVMMTKRIDRFFAGLPDDWGDGWDNVTIGCTCENQAMADKRLPIFRAAPIKHKLIAAEPLLGPMDLSDQLGPWVEAVMPGGESGPEARVCNFDWVLSLHRQCLSAGVAFEYHQTGAKLIKDGRLYRIPRKYQHAQARKAALNLPGAGAAVLPEQEDPDPEEDE